MNKKDSLKRLEDLYEIREIKEGFNSVEEIISWSNKVAPLLKKVDKHYYYNFIANSHKFNLPLSSHTLKPALRIMISQVEMAIEELKFQIEKGLDEDEIFNLKGFLKNNLRKAIFDEPKDENNVQDAVESLLIGRGLSKGIDYDRERGRVKVSIKEVVPDFIFHKLNLALEVKFCKDKSKSKRLVDEINADIRAYSKKFSNLLFLVYDLGIIRDEDEFKKDLDNKENISVIIVKH